MADIEEFKYIFVVAVILWSGVIAYLIYLDAKVRNLEKIAKK